MKNLYPLISVIVPVYKVEAYLDKCVGAIVNQTYRNLEIILVDDGSPDNCPVICDRWAEKDCRIKVIHKQNGGAAAAKNSGLDIAGGDYVGFVDGDDWIEPVMYEHLLQSLLKNKAEIAESKWAHFSDNNLAITYEGGSYTQEIFSAEEALRESIRERKFLQTPVNKLYAIKLVKNIRFVPGKYIDDEFWTYLVLGEAKNLVHLNVVFYHYYQRPDSAMNRPYTPGRLDAIEALRLRLEYVKENFPSLHNDAALAYVGGCQYHFQLMCRQSFVDPDKKLRENLFVQYCSVDPGVFRNLRLKYRMWHKLFRNMPYFTSAIRNFLKIGL